MACLFARQMHDNYGAGLAAVLLFAHCQKPVFFTARSAGVNWHRVRLLVCEGYQGPCEEDNGETRQ
ncbi:hypothetical protein [Acidithiobacillus sp.]